MQKRPFASSDTLPDRFYFIDHAPPFSVADTGYIVGIWRGCLSLRRLDLLENAKLYGLTKMFFCELAPASTPSIRLYHRLAPHWISEDGIS